MKLKELAELIGGELREEGGADATGVAGLADATSREISFIVSSKNLPNALKSDACCFLVPEFFDDIKKPQIRVEDPELVFFTVLLEKFRPRPAWPEGEVSRQAYVDPGASLAGDVTVMPFAHVSSGVSIGSGTVLCPGVFIGEGARVGEGCVLYPNVSVMDGVTMGDRVAVHSGTVIGSDGYGYMQREGVHVKKPQVGGVIIGDDVEIGANCAIDRATIGNTSIGAGAKLDNLVHVAHNVTIGKGSLITGQVGIAGSAKIGKYAIMAGQSGIKDHVSVSDNSVIAAKSAVLNDIKEPGMYAGIPAIPINTWLRSSAAFAKMPELIKTVRRLEKRLEELENPENKE
jgi:UDP-3-O-[3-hydroxymyristoyl] glucosamine N-acyltransferase